MQVSSESGWLDVDAQAFVEKVDESLNEMVRPMVGEVDQRILAIDDLDRAFVFAQRRQVGIILPKLGMHGTHVCHKLVGITRVQVPNSGSQHDRVTSAVRAP